MSTYLLVLSALGDAGYRHGKRHAHSLKGDAVAAARSGFLLSVKGGCVMVDHQGKDQAAWVGRYAETLRAAGLVAEVRAAREGRRKRVVCVWRWVRPLLRPPRKKRHRPARSPLHL